MVQKQKTEIHSWWYWIAKWLRSLVGVRRALTSSVKTRHYSADRTAALFTLARSTPGAVETWRIVHGGANGNLLITLDNLPVSRAYYKEQRRKARESGRLYTTSADERGVFLADGEIHTHRLSFSWVSWHGKRQKVTLLGVYDGDLAGFTKYYAMSLKMRAISTKDENLKRQLGNRAALRIGEAIAFELLELKAIPGIPWEERVAEYDWHESLLSYTRLVLKAPDFDPKIICRSR